MTPAYDVFLSYRRSDAAAVEQIAERLDASGVRTFLDTWELVPGEAWQEALERALDRSTACAVMIGPSGPGPWQNEEMRTAIDDRVKSQTYRVIPVFLPGSDAAPERLPRFLKRYTACTFPQADDAEALRRLIAGIRGEAPGRVLAAPRRAASGLRPALGVEARTWRRARVVDEALAAYRGTPLPIVLHGLPGMGKTVAACHLAEELAADGRTVIAVPAAASPADLADLAVRDVVLVLDGLSFAPGGQIGPVLDELADGPASVVITSDRRPEAGRAVHAIPVPPLDDEESVAFIDHYAKLFRLDLDAGRLARDLGPLLLSHPAALRALLGEARSTPAGLLASGPVRTVHLDPIAGLIDDLSPDDLRALAFADLVAGAPVPGLIRSGVALPPSFGESLGRLVEHGLVHSVADTVDVPALVSGALRRTHPEEPGAVRAALTEVGGDLEPEVLAAVAARAAGRDDVDLVVDLCAEPLLEVVNRRGRWTEYVLLLRLRAEAADRRGENADAVAYRLRLVRKLAQMRDFSGAWEALRAVDVPQWRAEHLRHRGFLNHLERNYPAALSDLTAALALHRESGDEPGQLIAHKLLGHLHLALHDHRAAGTSYRSALEIAGRLDDTRQRLEIETSLAACELHADGPAVAEQRLRRAMAEMSAGGYLAQLAAATMNLTVVLETQGRFAEARETAIHGARIATPDASITGILRAMADRLAGRVPIADHTGRS